MAHAVGYGAGICSYIAAAEEVVDMRGGWLTQTYFYSLVRWNQKKKKKKKKRSQPTDKSFPPHQLPFLADIKILS